MLEFLTELEFFHSEGLDIDLNALEKKHQVPTFLGMSFCYEDDVDKSEEDLKRILMSIEKNGGKIIRKYNPRNCTHFIKFNENNNLKLSKNTTIIDENWIVSKLNFNGCKRLLSCEASDFLVNETPISKSLDEELANTSYLAKKYPSDKTYNTRNESMPHNSLKKKSNEIDLICENTKRQKADATFSNDSQRELNLFSQLSFKIHESFDEKKKSIIKDVILSNNGILIENNTSKTEYLICPLINKLNNHNTLYDQSKHIVTEYWLESSFCDKKIKEKTDSIVFQPLRMKLPLEEFKNYSIGISEYKGLEREHLKRLLILMGCKVTETFSSKNTHLLCKNKSGAKYERALKLNIPVRDMEWLSLIIKERTIQEYSESNPKQRYTKKDNAEFITEAGTPTVITHGNMPDTTPKESHKKYLDSSAKRYDQMFHVNSPTRAAELISDVEKTTPAKNRSPLSKHSTSLKKTKESTPYKSNNTSMAINELATPTFSRKLSENIESVLNCKITKAQKNCEALSSKILHKTSIYISPSLKDSAEYLKMIVHKLGGSLQEELDIETATHYVYNYDNKISPDLCAQLKIVSLYKIYIVSPLWLVQCEFEKRRVEEKRYIIEKYQETLKQPEIQKTPSKNQSYKKIVDEILNSIGWSGKTKQSHSDESNIKYDLGNTIQFRSNSRKSDEEADNNSNLISPIFNLSSDHTMKKKVMSYLETQKEQSQLEKES